MNPKFNPGDFVLARKHGGGLHEGVYEVVNSAKSYRGYWIYRIVSVKSEKTIGSIREDMLQEYVEYPFYSKSELYSNTALDYFLLYQMFGDESYLDSAKDISEIFKDAVEGGTVDE